VPIDGTIIQAKVWRGYGIAAAKTGTPHDLYRPSGPAEPLALLNRVATLPATLDARPSYKFAIPALHGDWERYALVDGAVVQPGDYLVSSSDDIYFIAAMPALQPIICAICTETISVRRLTAARAFGAIEDRSDAATSETELFSDWPVSMLFSGRGRGATDDIPGDQADPDYQIIMPAVPGCDIPRSGDVLLDHRRRRFAVGWVETSSLGWRMLARLLTVG
jgi:hypothetical protein